MPQMDRLLEQGIVPDAVMCLNDPSALGAMAALQEHGLLEKTTGLRSGRCTRGEKHDQ